MPLSRRWMQFLIGSLLTAMSMIAGYFGGRRIGERRGEEQFHLQRAV